LVHRFIERRTGAGSELNEPDDPTRKLTILEHRLLSDMFETIAESLAGFSPLKCRGKVEDTDPSDFMQTDSGNVPLVEIRMYTAGHSESGIWVRGPGAAFLPPNENARADLLASLNQASVELTAQLGKAKLKVEDLWHLTPGSLIPLDSAVGDPIRVLIGNRLKLEGEPLVSRGNIAIRILETNSNGALR